MKRVAKPFAGLVCLAFVLGWGYGVVIQNNALRISWLETTRRKLLLYEGRTIELYQQKKLEQSFVANYPGLSQIDILFRNNDDFNQQTVHFRLKDNCDSKDDIFSTSIVLPHKTEVAFHSFLFPPIDDSAGQSYCLVLEAPEAMLENPVQLPLSAGDLYPFGYLNIDDPKPGSSNNSNSPLPPVTNDNSPLYKVYLPFITNVGERELLRFSDIGFRLHYKGPILPTFQVFVARLTANKPYFWGNPWFYAGLGLSYTILLIGLGYVTRKTMHMK